MTSFYTNLTNEEDMLHTSYFLTQKVPSYSTSELELPDIKACVSQPSISASYLNLLSGSSILSHNHVDTASVGSRDDAIFISPTGIPMNMQLNFMSPFSADVAAAEDTRVFSEELVHSRGSGQKPQNRGLCLSLGSQEQSLAELSSRPNQFSNPSLGSVLSFNLQSEDQLSHDVVGLKNVEYLSFHLSEGTQDTVKYEVFSNSPNQICSKQTDFFPSLHQTSEFSGTFYDSKYLMAAQDLLDEVVSVHRARKESEKTNIKNSLCQFGSTGTGGGRNIVASEQQELSTNPTHDLSPSELHDMHNRMTKFLSMLDEVNGRYMKYSGQMQALVSSFDAVVGCGFAARYSSLALRTISCQFRTLRDTIKKQVQDIQKNLGNSNGLGILPGLRYVNEKIRQQKVVEQFGLMRQPWRSQRGLPETAVSVLRAWLFEHFLHPYPKEPEKIVLAKQAGLTRSQVANWFINARVRLWKPMIEDIYKEEFRDTELKPSPEHAVVTQEISVFEGREEEFERNIIAAASYGNTIESRLDIFSSAEVGSCRPDPSYEAGAFQDSEVNHGRIQSRKNLNENEPNRTGDWRHNDLIFDGAMGDQVSLALGLQRCEKDSHPTPGGVHPQGNE